MKKLVYLLIVLTLLLTACGGANEPAPAAEVVAPVVEEAAPVVEEAAPVVEEVAPTAVPATEVPPTEVPPVPMIALVPAGRIGKVGYMTLAGEGYNLAAADFGFEPVILESEVPEEWERNVRTAAQDGNEFIVGVGSSMLDAVKSVAAEFPDTMFALVDENPGLPNSAGLISQEQEGTFLAGILAAQMTTHTELEGMNDAKVIGFIGGMDIPVIHRFLSGLQQGVAYVDPSVNIVVSYVGSFNDPAKAKELALSMINNQGVDIIYSVAGSPGDAGVFEAVGETGIYGIGSDVNWDEKVPGHVLTSVLKHTDVAVYDVIDRYLKGEFQAGEIKYGVASGVMDITDMSVMGDKIPQEIRDSLADAKQKIKDGLISVNRPLK